MEKEELENKILELVKEKFKKTGGANGIDGYEINKILNIEDPAIILDILKKLLSEKRIALLNHLNGVSYTLPK